MLAQLWTSLIASGTLLLLSRVSIILIWTVALGEIWRHRSLPHVNQALAGALSMIFIQALLLYDANIPRDVLIFFLALSHLTVAISYTQLLRMVSSEMPAVEREPLLHSLWTRPYTKPLVTITLAGVGSTVLDYALR